MLINRREEVRMNKPLNTIYVNSCWLGYLLIQLHNIFPKNSPRIICWRLLADKAVFYLIRLMFSPRRFFAYITYVIVLTDRFLTSSSICHSTIVFTFIVCNLDLVYQRNAIFCTIVWTEMRVWAILLINILIGF